MIDKRTKKTKYVAGLPSYNVIILLVLIAGLSTIGYFILKSRANTVIKPPMQGLLDRKGYPEDASYRNSLGGFVVNVDWSQLQPNNGSELNTANIDDAILKAKSSNLKLKMRLYAGSSSPTWLKNRVGTFSYVEPVDNKDTTIQVPKFWVSEFGEAYSNLISKLAIKYDNEEVLREVTISRCTTEYAEPFNRGIIYDKNKQNLIQAGYSVNSDIECQQEAINTHKVWAKTHSSLAANWYQTVKKDGPDRFVGATDQDITFSLLDYCRNNLGERCTLENNSIGETIKGGYTKLYQAIKQHGPAITFQTETDKKMGDLGRTLDWAIGQGANAVELNSNYRKDLSASQLASYNNRLQANPTNTIMASPSPTPTPTSTPTPKPSNTPSPTSQPSSLPTPPTSNGAPSTPSNLVAIANGYNQVSLTWQVSTDDTGVGGYTIQRDGKAIANVNDSSFIDTDVAPATTYKYKVRAFDADKNTSAPSAEVLVTTAKLTDSIKPSKPINLRVNPGTYNALITWMEPKDNKDIANYVISINDKKYTTTSLVYSVVGLKPKTSYFVSVKARDKVGNLSEPSSISFKTDCSRFMWWCW